MLGWQEIYEELSDSGLHIISAAQDTGGEAAVGKWFDRANATYTQIIDRQHIVSSLYNLTNVPSAVWIDEEGRIVRKDDGAYSKKYTFGSIEAGSDQYPTAIHDWVKNGSSSQYIFNKEQIAKRLKSRTFDEELAEANFQLAVYFHLQKNARKADHFWQAAQKLNPESWNYHRQDWSFDAVERREKFGKKRRAQGDKPYYAPIELMPPKGKAQDKNAKENKRTESDGWVSLFDGKTMQGWRPFKGEEGKSTESWIIQDGCLMSTGKPGDIVTNSQFENFELKFEWKVSDRANSGVFYRVTEDVEQIHESGLEYQVLDNIGQAGRPASEQAAACYGIIGPTRDATRPVGEWNQGRIVVNGNEVQHYLNGHLVVQYEIASDQYNKQVDAGPLRSHAKLAKSNRGHITLQNYHGHQVWFRGIFVKSLQNQETPRDDRTSKNETARQPQRIAPGAVNKQPNIVVVLVDDMRFDELGVAGHPYVKTPHMDRIATEGAYFTNSFTVNPLCSPSRATLLTGQHAHYHGITDNLARNQRSHQLPTFARRLQESGYDTSFIGKWHMGNDDTARPGFRKWACMRGQGEAIDPTFNLDGERTQIKGYVTDIIHDLAIDFVKEEREKPFLLYLSHKALHPNIFQADDGSAVAPPDGQTRSGFIAADRHAGMYGNEKPPRRKSYGVAPTDKPALMRRINNLPPLSRRTVTSDKVIRERQEMLMAVDEGLGQLLELLETNGQLDDTIVVVTSDHGYWYGEHGLDDVRRLAYEEGIRIPMLIRYPKRIEPGIRPTQTALTLDLAPTMIEFAGLEIENVRHGRSLVPILTGQEVNEWRKSFLIEYYSDTVFERMDRMGYKAVRTDRYKYIRYEELDDMDELYDLQADPYELKNIIREPDSSPLVRELNAELDRLIEVSSR
ncbi:MAG: sulfatase-like hydrolase/transferase [Pirellulales bacterium]|nr:sulfatase-like hydrolase/transferase [Pirellulales bacterium]